jgi:hypothetical protein
LPSKFLSTGWTPRWCWKEEISMPKRKCTVLCAP